MDAQHTKTGNASPRTGITGLDVFSALFAVVGDIADNFDQTEAQLQEIKDKLEELDQQINQLSSQISNLHAAVEAGNQWVAGVILYGRYEQRLRFLLHYLNARLSVDDNGQFQPDSRAQEWADEVLGLSSDGVEEILFHLHDMMMGTSGLFGGRSLFLIYEARMEAASNRYWNQVHDFLEYVVSLEVSGYAAKRTALHIKGRSSKTADILDVGRERIRQQGAYLDPFVKEWPTGTYGLPMTNTGCPAFADVTWHEGQRFQDQDGASLSSWSSGLHFPSNTYYGGHMIQKFCMKTFSYEGSGNWPRGSYCIFQKWSCPSGFQTGSVYWDDEDNGNDNTVSGSYPDGVYNTNTRIYFCCRSDGNRRTPILLPSRRPFYLFRQSSYGCQEVLNMRVTEEYYLWDDENSYNDDTNWGSHPYDSGDGRNHKLWYCYYQPN
ncbi:uncharacterized protein LOC118416513 [Branchiostoma floridae]|nr:uncharacterized protein LOC118416513 [Branchiostoma floridae]